MRGQHVFLVTYDIADSKRLRQVHKLMRGYGEWLQYSIFQCRLDDRDHAELIAELETLINHNQDHILLFDLGHPEGIEMNITSLGKPYLPPDTSPMIF